MRASRAIAPASARSLGSCSSPKWLPFLYLTNTIQRGRQFSASGQLQRPAASDDATLHETQSRSLLQEPSQNLIRPVIAVTQKDKLRHNTGQWASSDSSSAASDAFGPLNNASSAASDAFGPLNDSLCNIQGRQLRKDGRSTVRRMVRPRSGVDGAHTAEADGSDHVSRRIGFIDRRSSLRSRRSDDTSRDSFSHGDIASGRRGQSPSGSNYVSRESIEHRDSIPSRRRVRPSSRDSNRDGRVPFEFGDGISSLRAAPSLRLAKLKGKSAPDSTLTTKEYQAFQTLLALQDTRSGSQDGSLGIEEEQGLALNNALKASLGIDITPAEGASPYDPAIYATAVQRPEINKMLSLMRDARSDAKLWSILYTQVCRPVLRSVRELGLLDPERVQRRAAEQDPGAIVRLSRSFPKHLLVFANVMRSHFPSSLYNLHLLPWLKQSGEEIFMLGASTPLYNLHLQALLTKHCDIPAMLEVLQDMHDRVYDYDGQTIRIIDLAIKQAQTAPKSSALAALWWTEHMQDMFQQLKAWRLRVVEHVNEKGFRKAREQEELATREGQTDEQELIAQSSF